MPSTFGPDPAVFAAKVDRMAREFRPEVIGKRLREAGQMAAKLDAPAAVRADIGDLSMSHWWRRKPIQLAAEVKAGTPPLEVIVRPVPRTAGPWRVLQDGRQSGAKGDVRHQRQRFSKKRGEYTQTFRFKRTSGATEGKQTWSDAVALFEKHTPARVRGGHVRAVVKVFKG